MTTEHLPVPQDHLPPEPASVEELGVLVDNAVDLAPNTMVAYRWQWRHFRTWCDDQDREYLPATPRTVAIWLASRWTAGAAVSSLQLGRAAVRWVHREEGHADPTSDVAVTRFLGACSRGQEQRDSASGYSRSAIPADAGLVRAMLDAIRWSDAAYQIQLRDRALIATAYVTAARRSELGALLLADVEADGVEFRIRITRSKTQQTGKDRTAGVINSRTVRAADHLSDWLDIHPLRGVPQAPLFVRLHRSGSCADPVPLSGRGGGTADRLVGRGGRPAWSNRSQHPSRGRHRRLPGRSAHRGTAATGRLGIDRHARPLRGKCRRPAASPIEGGVETPFVETDDGLRQSIDQWPARDLCSVDPDGFDLGGEIRCTGGRITAKRPEGAEIPCNQLKPAILDRHTAPERPFNALRRKRVPLRRNRQAKGHYAPMSACLGHPST